MIELNLKCDSVEQARIYLNANNYLNLLYDLNTALRNAQKHGTDADVVRIVNSFMQDILQACDHAEGAY